MKRAQGKPGADCARRQARNGCQDLVYGGPVEPDSSWQHFVPSNYWTWVRFVEDPSEGGCAAEARDEWRYGGSGYGYQAQNVW